MFALDAAEIERLVRDAGFTPRRRNFFYDETDEPRRTKFWRQQSDGGGISLDQNTAPQFREPIMRLTENSPRVWGKMSITEMVAHLTRSFEISLGKIPQENKSNVLLRWLSLLFLFMCCRFRRAASKRRRIFCARQGPFKRNARSCSAELTVYQ